MKGFTLIELMIVIAIVGILAAIAVPSYQNYTRKAYFTEIVHATRPYAIGVNQCFQTQGALTNCNGGSNGVPSNLTVQTGGVKTVSVTSGIITVTPVAQHGITAAETYVLTPTVSNNTLTWQVSGGCTSTGSC